MNHLNFYVSIQSLEVSERKKMDIKSQLNREKRFLLRKLNQLKEQYQYNSHRIRNISESSSGFSSISTSPTYEGLCCLNLCTSCLVLIIIY